MVSSSCILLALDRDHRLKLMALCVTVQCVTVQCATVQCVTVQCVTVLTVLTVPLHALCLYGEGLLRELGGPDLLGDAARLALLHVSVSDLVQQLRLA